MTGHGLFRTLYVLPWICASWRSRFFFFEAVALRSYAPNRRPRSAPCLGIASNAQRSHIALPVGQAVIMLDQRLAMSRVSFWPRPVALPRRHPNARATDE